ncbi:MAG: zinc-dependent alcohol dehydrogenase family protein [Actinomycetota bacterium]
MRAILLDDARAPLRAAEVPKPEPDEGQVRVRVAACGVCRTDVHIADGDLEPHRRPLVLGHQVVGVIDAVGPRVVDRAVGQRVGVPWLGWTCGRCRYCTNGRENLCPNARFTGYDLDGGYAEAAVADARFCLPLASALSDEQVAPLLCGGLIGWRCLSMTGEAERLGIFGFGSAAHILTQVARFQGRRVFAFTRPGDVEAQRFARSVGAEWAGGTDERPPEELDAAIVFASAGELVPLALAAVAPGGTVVCGEIAMSDIPSFPYELLWRERTIRSVANLTRRDGEEFLRIAAEVPVKTTVETIPLERASEALDRLRAGRVEGSLVLVP